jgi:hypothetical protein
LIGFEDERVPEGAIRELDRLHLIDMRPEPGKRLGTFSITSEGRSLGGHLATAGDGAVDLSWDAVEPVLRQIHNIWKREGALPLGIPGRAIVSAIQPSMGSTQLAPILQELARAEWIEYRQLVGPPLPEGIRPTSRTLPL